MGRDVPRPQPAPLPAEGLEVEVTRIGAMTINQLRATWRKVFASRRLVRAMRNRQKDFGPPQSHPVVAPVCAPGLRYLSARAMKPIAPKRQRCAIYTRKSTE